MLDQVECLPSYIAEFHNTQLRQNVAHCGCIKNVENKI